jgi:hypothetical protein
MADQPLRDAEYVAAEEWWEGSYDAIVWRDQMREEGYAELPYEGFERGSSDPVNMICEQRWRPVRYQGWVPSRLWDEATPSTYSYRPSKALLAEVRQVEVEMGVGSGDAS